jgi:hypothetical protein
MRSQVSKDNEVGHPTFPSTSFDVNLRYLYALRRIPQHVFDEFVVALKRRFAMRNQPC